MNSVKNIMLIAAAVFLPVIAQAAFEPYTPGAESPSTTSTGPVSAVTPSAPQRRLKKFAVSEETPKPKKRHTKKPTKKAPKQQTEAEKIAALDQMRLFLEKGNNTLRQRQDNKVLDPQIENATMTPSSPLSSTKEQAATIYEYIPGTIYTVWCKEGAITDIWLQPGEELNDDVKGGDKERWLVDSVKSGSSDGVVTHILIRPKYTDLSNTIQISTNRHSYNLKALSTLSTFTPIVRWSYPKEERMTLLSITPRVDQTKETTQSQIEQPQKEKGEGRKTIRERDNDGEIPSSPDKMDFRYKIDSNAGIFHSEYSWKPLRTFDDGTKTYIQNNPSTKNRELPVLLVKDRSGDANVVNYRVNGEYFIVDRLFEEAELRNGTDQLVTIRKTKSE